MDNEPDIEEIVAEIRQFHRKRVFAMEQRKRANLALGSLLRTQLGWQLDLPSAERKAISERAAALAAAGEIAATIEILSARADLKAPEKAALTRARRAPPIDDPVFDEWRDVIVSSVVARAPFDAVEAAATRAMEKLAAELPVAAWWRQNVAKALASLAVIIGEAGDLSKYPNPAKLWKRMGVGLVDGVRQGGLTKAASKQDWIAHGYNKKRRARLFAIGDALIKHGGAWRDLYLARKEYERAKAEARGLTIAPSAKIPKKRAGEFMSDGHVHRRAQRYMEKRLLRDLWGAWRAAESIVRPSENLPPASNVPADMAGPPAKKILQPITQVPAALSSDETRDQPALDARSANEPPSSGPATVPCLSPLKDKSPANSHGAGP